MLTEKCPFCGSYNDVNAFECYFCHKELPPKPGQKRKKKSRAPSPSFTPTIQEAPVKRQGPPGCLVLFVAGLFVLCSAIILQGIHSAYGLIHWTIPTTSDKVGTYVFYYLRLLENTANKLLAYPLIVGISVIILLVLCWGLLNLKPWARATALLLLGIAMIANLANFFIFVKNFYTTSENVISFFIILILIGLNGYCLLWFFENSRMFAKKR
jgi:hypothetical protein